MTLKIKVVRPGPDYPVFLNLPGAIYRKLSGSGTAPFYPPETLLPPPPVSLDSAGHCYFLATEDGLPAGRVAAAFDPRFPEQKTGFFGAFEAAEDGEVAWLLLDAAASWLAARGKKRMIGPVTMNTNQQVGLLVEGFQEPLSPFTPANPPYYRTLLENLGFKKLTDLYSFYHPLDGEVPSFLEKVAGRAKRRKGVFLRSLNLFTLRRDTEMIAAILNEGMAKNWGFLPLTSSEAENIVRYCFTRGDPSLALIITVNGEPAAFSLSLPPAGPGQIPRLALLAVVPGFRNLGLESLLIVKSGQILFRKGYSGFEISQVEENNQAILKIIARFGCRLAKRHRVYQKEIG